MSNYRQEQYNDSLNVEGQGSGYQLFREQQAQAQAQMAYQQQEEQYDPNVRVDWGGSQEQGQQSSDQRRVQFQQQEYQPQQYNSAESYGDQPEYEEDEDHAYYYKLVALSGSKYLSIFDGITEYASLL